MNRLVWLATGSSSGQVRAVATIKLQRLAALLKGESCKTEADAAQHVLLAADIKRLLENPAEVASMAVLAGAPPGAPIGDVGESWLATPAWFSARAPF